MESPGNNNVARPQQWLVGVRSRTISVTKGDVESVIVAVLASLQSSTLAAPANACEQGKGGSCLVESRRCLIAGPEVPKPNSAVNLLGSSYHSRLIGLDNDALAVFMCL